MVKCIICSSAFVAGIGECCSRACHNRKINSQRDYSQSKITLDMHKRIAEYDQNPKLCPQCSKPIPYHSDKKGYKYCSRSCGATYANTQRGATHYLNHAAKLRAKADLSNRAKWPMTKVTFGKCKECDKVYRKTPGKLYCSEPCKIGSGIGAYRRACKFKISKSQHPQLFDNDLLIKHEWYRAANHPKGYNPDGATWDHLFRIEDGFKLGVNPEIMRHPANAEMISWKDNFARKTSSITYEQLLERIKNWG